jgi:tRNA-dihydrouridine synthase
MSYKLPKPFFVLAPMDDVTDTVFRRVVADCAPPDLYFTEFVNVDGLQSPGRKNLLKKLQFTEKETPLIAQIWGKKPENYYKTTKELIDMRFAGVDINMGCPVKKVIKDGCCSALINDRGLAGEIIKATQEAAGDFPVSVKTRLGFREADLSWIEFLLQQKLNMLTIHCRTVKQMSKVPAQWEYMNEIKKLRDAISPTTLLVVNGDIMSKKHGEEIVEQYGLDGAMIGRGIFHDPYAFADESPWPNMSEQDKKELYAKHVKLFADTWKDSERRVQTLNKFCKLYINDFPNSSELRAKLMEAKSTDELLELLR